MLAVFSALSRTEEKQRKNQGNLSFDGRHEVFFFENNVVSNILTPVWLSLCLYVSKHAEE